ncbi:MAG: hypothetical protein ATN34_04805 [Epulopiscium sp. Nele67-Bin002]|nr:MAG: hypothetical protein ATN34_04805 [Epulopiscium sp. Nele67-Bin002]
MKKQKFIHVLTKLMLSSMLVLNSTNVMGMPEYFTGDLNYLNDNMTVVNKSITGDNLVVTTQSIIADNYIAYVLITMETADGSTINHVTDFQSMSIGSFEYSYDMVLNEENQVVALFKICGDENDCSMQFGNIGNRLTDCFRVTTPVDILILYSNGNSLADFVDIMGVPPELHNLGLKNESPLVINSVSYESGELTVSGKEQFSLDDLKICLKYCD